MATNIEQIFRDFVMNKIREIEGEGLHTGVTAEGHSNGSVPYSVKKTGFGKEVALVMENHGDVCEHPCSAEVAKCAEKTENTASEDVALSKEGSMTLHKKNKKHKRHKSKKKKKHKEEREGTSESGLESGAECHARVKGQCPGRERVAEDDRAAVVRVPTDQPMEEMDGRPKRHKHVTKKKKKKNKKDEKHEKKSPPRSRSESFSGSESESKSPSKMPPISYPVVPLEKNRESSSFGSPPKKSPKKLSEEMTPVQCEVFVQVSEHSEAVGIHEVVSSQTTAIVATNVIDNQVNIAQVLDLPDIVPKVENAHKEEGRVDSYVQKDTEESSESVNKEKGPCCSQTPKKTIDKSHSQRVCSSSRSSSRRRRSSGKKRSGSRSRRRKSQTSSVKRSEQKSSSISSRKCEDSYFRFCMRYKRSRSRSRHHSQSRSVVQRHRSHSGSFSKCRRSRSRSKRSRSRHNRRSRPPRRYRHSRSRSSRSHSRKSCSGSVRRTRQTRSRSIVIRRHSRSKSLVRRNRRSRSRSLTQICSRSRSATRRQSKSHSTQRSRHSRSTPRARRRRSKTLSPPCSKKSRSPIRHCHSKSPCGGRKQSKSPKRNRRSMSRSPTKCKSKCRSISGFTLSCDKRPLLTEEKKVSGSPTRELGDSDIPLTEIHASGCNADKREEEDAVSTAKTVQCMSLKGSHLNEETPANLSDLKLEHAFEEICTDNASKIASSVGSWRPIPFLVDSNAKPNPISATESFNVFTSAAVTLTELSEEFKCPTMEKTPLTPSTSWDLSHETSKDHLQNRNKSSLSEDVGKESDFGCRSCFPQSNEPPKSLSLGLKNSFPEMSGPILFTDIKAESDMPLSYEQRSRSPNKNDSSEIETKADYSVSHSTLKEDGPLMEKMDSEATSPLNRKKSPFKEGLSVSPSSRKKHSKSRSRSRRKKSVSTRRKHSRSNSTPRRRRSQSVSTTRRKKSKSRSPGRKRSPSQSWGQNKSKFTTRRRRSRSKLKKSRSKSTSRSTKRKRTKSRTPVQKKHSKSRSPRRKRSRSAVQRRSRSADKRRHSKSLSQTRKRRMRSRSPNRNHRSRSRRSRSISRRQRGSFRSRSFDRRDRWRREPSHSPVVILRKKRSASRTCRSTSKTPPRLTELDKEQLLEIAKANAAAMCAKAGMPIPESLRPKATPTSVSSPLNLPLPLNLSMGMPLGMPNISMNAAMATMTAATMTAALTNMSALANMPNLLSITNKPSPTAMPNTTNIEEVKRKVTQKANSISIKELTEKCKMIAESKEEMAVAQPHMSDDEDDEKSSGGGAFRESKGISFNLSNPLAKPAVRTEAAFAKEFPVSSGSQHRKKESEGDYGEWVPIDRKAERDKAASVSISVSTAGEEECKDSVFPDAPLQPVDITLAVSERAAAQKRLAENPFDVNAICMLSRAQEQVDAWAQSNSIPGLFTGSTGAQVLSSEELSNSGPQAWIKKGPLLKHRGTETERE
ncbi:serine/arginine repetitive matrix protein 2-like isoform X2 [Brienomyrus brachyistius]|uniref:serine/arginine repetitive matrix protein 2-like isoform X2 n=1 Tax=Brienomyrus brachyistius TaxID=42636 RepID=UPI0020B3E4CC|nr:serine/arginine repetitive matrix protein 2-like isoform X2 [Brienomyrus brachyistius]XP_048834973.1 serine/arginine repetitive matrix protein 2-like isoform X2 [Brienomyrus brachyistius]